MKTKIFIGLLVIFTLSIGLYLWQADRYPGQTSSEKDKEQVSMLDIKVQQALEALQDGSLPPMQAIGMLREVIDEDSTHFAALLSLGLMSMRTGQYDKAVERFETLLRHYDNEARVLDAAADAYLAVGDTAKAVDLIQQMLSLNLDQEVREALEKTLTSLEKTN